MGSTFPSNSGCSNSLFVPLAKWSMLLTGNYRCVTPHEPRSIRDAVHSDLKLSQSIYDHVDAVAQRLGADPKDQVPFEKYAKAAESLLKPSSAARAVASGAPFIERVDLLVKLISHLLGLPNAEIDRTVQTVDQKLNERIARRGAGPQRGAAILGRETFEAASLSTFYSHLRHCGPRPLLKPTTDEQFCSVHLLAQCYSLPPWRHESRDRPLSGELT